MPLRTDPSNQSKPTPLDYVKYALGVLAALLLVPAFLQGVLAFLQTFLQTLLSIVLTLNLLILSAVAGVAGIWIWQRRALAGESVTIESDIVIETPSRDHFASERNALEIPMECADLAIALPETTVVTLPDVSSETPPQLTDSDETQASGQSNPEESVSLIQVQLARRLGVSSSTIGVRKLKPDFGEWSSQKDPAGLAWRYCEEERQFLVMSAGLKDPNDASKPERARSRP